MFHPPAAVTHEVGAAWRGDRLRRLALAVLAAALLASAPALASGASGVVNLNTATAAQLEMLPGIGAKRASDIVALRKSVGRFENVDELLDVKGIGEKALAKLKPYVVLKGQTTLTEQ